MSHLHGELGENIIDLLTRLVGFPTESRSPNLDLIDFVADHAARHGGFAKTTGQAEEGRTNLHVRFGPEGPGGLLLSGHTDVVPAGSGWATDPYKVTAVDDQLRGRGTADMKGFIAVVMAICEQIEPNDLTAPLHIGLSYDEEIGCVGVRDLLAELSKDPSCTPELIVVGEPTSMQICVAHSGKRSQRVEVRAPSGHSSRAGAQPSAVSVAAELAVAVHRLNDFGPGASANVGLIHGGVAVNVLAPHCELEFEVRHAANVDPDELMRPLRGAIDQHGERLAAFGGNISIEDVISYPAMATDTGNTAVVHLAAAVACESGGPLSFGCEAGLYTEALQAPAVVLGPGDIADAHRPDEYVEVKELARCADALMASVTAFCARSHGH